MTGNKFRARADEWFKAADAVADPDGKLAHLDLAQRWLRLGNQLDEMGAETRCDTPLVPLQPDARLPPSANVTPTVPCKSEVFRRLASNAARYATADATLAESPETPRET
jgi:hypothetical protein